MIRALPLLALLIACGPPPHQYSCVSECGMQLDAPDEQWCQEMKELEGRAVKVLPRLFDDRFQLACSRLSGYTINVLAEPNFRRDIDGLLVSGLTNCISKVIYLGKWQPAEGALAHEMVHAIQGCMPRPPFDEKDFDHSNWNPEIYTALSEIREP